MEEFAIFVLFIAIYIVIIIVGSKNIDIHKNSRNNMKFKFTKKFINTMFSIIIGSTGIYFIGNFIQSDRINIFGQDCLSFYNGVSCYHPEWLAVGGGLLAVAIVIYRKK